ncbi:nucleoside phosphorylase [Desulfomarina sp.]
MRNEEVDILIHPRRGKREPAIPEVGLLLVNPGEAEKAHFCVRNSGGESRFLFNSNLSVNSEKGFFVAGPSIGAPMATMTLEKLIALGAKKIILFGWCGAIAEKMAVGDIILPNGAVAGEGTSRYYLESDEISPSQNLLSRLERFFNQHDYSTETGKIWSTDAIYRESRRQLFSLRDKKNVVGVDMEFSALCSVAQFRRAEFAAVLVVSDELYHAGWKPGFAATVFKRTCRDAIGLLLNQFLPEGM